MSRVAWSPATLLNDESRRFHAEGTAPTLSTRGAVSIAEESNFVGSRSRSDPSELSQHPPGEAAGVVINDGCPMGG